MIIPKPIPAQIGVETEATSTGRLMTSEPSWHRLDGIRAPAGPMRRNALQTLRTMPWCGLSSATLTMRSGNGKTCHGQLGNRHPRRRVARSTRPHARQRIRKTRPCIVVSPPEMRDYLRTVIVAPMTTGNRPPPFRLAVSFAGKNGLILLDQMRTLDKQRLVPRLGAVKRLTLRPRSLACATSSQIDRGIGSREPSPARWSD